VSIALSVSFLVSAATGVLLLYLVWPHGVARLPRLLGIALGIGLGTGLSSILCFLSMLALGPTRGALLVEVVLLGLLAFATVRRRQSARTSPADQLGEGEDSGLSRVMVAGFLVTLVAAASGFLITLWQSPHGGWDAWMNWDLRARLIYRGGEAWLSAFSNAIPWSHPDYPVLLSSLVVRSWLYAGGETLLGPHLVAATFTFGTVAVLATALAALRGPSQGLLGGLLLLSTSYFILQGTTLYADVPLAFFFLTTMVFLALDDRHGAATSRFGIMAGVAAGLGMWTKNEGLLFVAALAMAILFAGACDGWPAMRRRAMAFGTGLLPMLLLVAGFKIAFAPPNDLLSALSLDRTLGRLVAPDRYLLVLREYKHHIMSFGDNGFGGVVWLLTAYLLGLGFHQPADTRRWVRIAGVTLLLMLAGHFMVYVSMSNELSRHLGNSFHRLLLQLWPGALFLFFMLVRTPAETRRAA
jgi:hypothetical protein